MVKLLSATGESLGSASLFVHIMLSKSHELVSFSSSQAGVD